VNVQELGQTNAVRTQDLLIGDALGPVLPPNVLKDKVREDFKLHGWVIPRVCVQSWADSTVLSCSAVKENFPQV
jgi:hypothetical protein